MYTHIPKYHLKVVNDHFATKAYTPEVGINIDVIKGIFEQIKTELSEIRRAAHNPNRVKFLDTASRHPHIVFIDNATRW